MLFQYILWLQKLEFKIWPEKNIYSFYIFFFLNLYKYNYFFLWKLTDSSKTNFDLRSTDTQIMAKSERKKKESILSLARTRIMRITWRRRIRIPSQWRHSFFLPFSPSLYSIFCKSSESRRSPICHNGSPCGAHSVLI